jgi:hypothetical protein
VQRHARSRNSHEWKNLFGKDRFGANLHIVAHTLLGQLDRCKRFPDPRSLAKTTLCRRLSPITQICSLVDCAVPAIWADAFVTSRRNLRFRRQRQACHSHVANLRMLKFRLALRANENPCRHLAPPRGDSQKAGGHLEDCTNLPTGNQKHNQVLSVSASWLVFGAVSFASTSTVTSTWAPCFSYCGLQHKECGNGAIDWCRPCA